MLQGHKMAQALRSAANHLEAHERPDSADRCRAGADEIDRLLDVIRTRDKAISELQTQLLGAPGPYVIGECVLMGDRTPDFADYIHDGKAMLLVETSRDYLRDGGALLFKDVRITIEANWIKAPVGDSCK